MAKTLGKINGTTQEIRDGLRKRNLSLCLGRSDSDIINNSPEGNNDTNDNSMFAQRITDNNIKTVVQFSATETKYWKTGLAPHCYYSDGTATGQIVFVSDGILFMVVGMPGIQNRIDKMGTILTRNKPTRIDGGIETTPDGISWMAINAVPDSFDQLSSRYQEIAPFEDLLKNVTSTTSLSTKAKNICGAGSEGRTGNCCLYYGESGYDSIGGSTYAAGQFYKCLCSKCYRCIEMAEALNMKYVFNKFDPSGCTTCGCTGCDGENYPTDCGPCGCTIDWNENSYYTSVINDKHIPNTSALGRNADMINYHQENLFGSILSASADLSSMTVEEKMITAGTYDTNIKDGTLYLPIRAGSTITEALIPISTVYDAAKGRHMIDGFGEPKEPGSGYTSAVVDTVMWGRYFPNWPGDVNDRVKINLTPIGGLAKHLDEFLDLSTVIHVSINVNDITDAFDSASPDHDNTPKEFDFYAIQEFFTDAGAPMYAGLGPNATSYKSLVPVITVSNIGAEFGAEGSGGYANLPKGKEVMHNSERLVTTGNKKIYNETTLNNIVAYDSYRRSGTSLRVPLQTSYAKDLVGKTLCVITNIDDIAAKLSMNVESVYYHPKSHGNDDINFTKTKTLFRNPIILDFSQQSTRSVISLTILWGSQDPSKVTTS
jgi:hypothetical protein